MSTLTRDLDEGCRAALDLAKRALPEGQRLGIPLLLDALYHAALAAETDLGPLAHVFPAPEPLRDQPGSARVDEPLKAVFLGLSGRPVSSRLLFAALVHSGVGGAALAGRGLSEPDRAALDAALASELVELLGPLQGLPAPDGAPPFEVSPEAATVPATGDAAVTGGPPAPRATPPDLGPARRRRIAAELGEYGALLTDPALPVRATARVALDRPLRSLVLHLLTPRSRNVLLVGPPGIGKTSLLHALASKLRERPADLPASLHDLELFELGPSFPRAPGPLRGEIGPAHDYQRVHRFLTTLEGTPGLVLWVDRFYPFLGLLHRLSIHQELFDAFIHALDRGAITCIGSLNPDELARLGEWDPSLSRRFRVLQLSPPTGDDLLRILDSRRRRLEAHFQPLALPPELLPRAVALTDEHLRERQQPEKALRLLESACARAVMEDPPSPALTEAHLLQALEDFVGPVVVPGPPLDVDGLRDRLSQVIVGQDAVLRQLAEAVVAGRADNAWFLRPGPRGVFLFGGPTGVGKTETAVQLARLLGGGREALVRVDCQNLQGSGSGWEANTLTWRLLGVAPGYKGHVPGCRDGLLVKVRDFPECVLLFDEFEKADSTVGRLMLRILDEGKAQDSEGNDLDFRRCFVVLTSNAGVSYPDPERGSMLFTGADPARQVAEARTGDLQKDLLSFGLGQEFLGRIQHVLLFRGLAREDVIRVVERQLAELSDFARVRGKTLAWDDGVREHLAGLWQRQQNLGARYLTSLVRQHILDPLNIAASRGELGEGVHTIRLSLAPAGGTPARRLEGGVLVVELAGPSRP